MLRVSIFGAGQLGKGVGAILRAANRYRVSGPFSRHERETALTSGAEVVIIATTTRFRDVAPDIELAIRAGSNVLVSAEECAYPFVVDMPLAERLNRLALEQGVSVAGCGINPGLIFDSLVLTLLGATPNGCRIEVRRTADISQFGSVVLRRIGLGRDAESFAEAVAREEILGHAGFPQSMHTVAAAVGLSVQHIRKEIHPLITDHPIELPGRMSIRAGESAGVDQTYTAFVGGDPWFTCHWTGHVDLAGTGRVASDEIQLYAAGVLLQTLQARPSIAPQSGSQNMVANSIDRIIAARPGWRTVAELAPAYPGAYAFAPRSMQ